ncbi:uncharacterized protein LOC143915272 [Arctopsyche grandis]|uniref:uncharacterized protein LOC143915272 n=1 Tax=Arctopsyche grandis TaxID=121162 RepID=UPI00406DA0B2
MHQIYSALLVLAAVTLASGQLFNDIVPFSRGGSKGGFQKTINFDNVKLSERPGARNGYLPPEPPQYLPPRPGSPTSTSGPTYLPPTTTRPPKIASYMPSLGTFPPTKYYTYPSTSSTTTRKPMPAPSTLPPLTTTRLTTTGYYYNKPAKPFEVEALRRSKF